MPVIIVTTPHKSNGALTSKWVAVHSGGGVKFKFKRTDFAVTSTSDNSGKTRLNISGGGVPFSGSTLLTTGGYVYVMLANGVTGLYLIEAGSTATTIETDIPWTSSTTGYVNIITDYHDYLFTVDFEYSTDNGSTWIPYAEDVSYDMGADQMCYVDCSPYVKSLVSAAKKKIPSSSTRNDTIDGLDAHIRLVLNEYFVAPTGAVTQSAGTSQELRIMNGANQLGHVNGENMLAFMTNSTPTQVLKWLSDFVQPTYFKDFPFHLSFIYSELMTGSIDCNQKMMRGATALSNNNYAIDTANIRHVNRYFLDTTAYTVVADTIQAKLLIHSGADLSETITIKNDGCAVLNPVCLKWFGLRSWNFWVFKTRQDEDINISTKQGELSPYIFDLSTADTDSDFISKEAVPGLKVFAEGLDSNDIAGLRTLLTSPKVMMLTNPSTWVADGEDKWQTVRINAGRFSLGDNKNAQRSLEISLELPELYIQTN